MSLVPVAEALALLLDGVSALPAENVPLDQAAGRVLATPLEARRTHPPFPASAMDGYAVHASDLANPPAILTVIGEVPAGHSFSGRVGPGECVRIFTGAPVPEGADAVLIQEDSEKLEGQPWRIRTGVTLSPGRNIRPAGQDFIKGEIVLQPGRVLDGAALALAAAANHPELSVIRQPKVAILATGDELVPPGAEPGTGQIIASNSYGIAALVEECGAITLDLGLVPDIKGRISQAILDAVQGGADVIVTLGGASVGDHDLVGQVLDDLGIEILFHKVAMRPGKPVMAGRLQGAHVVGLPGNPVSAMVAAHLFLLPLTKRLAGRSITPDIRMAQLVEPIGANGARQDYARALVTVSQGHLLARPFSRQDSSMLRVLAEANALIIREPWAPEAHAGEACRVMMLRPLD